jgi:hypothetical protein
MPMNKRRFLSSRLARMLGLVTPARGTTGSQAADRTARRRPIDANVEQALTKRRGTP